MHVISYSKYPWKALVWIGLALTLTFFAAGCSSPRHKLGLKPTRATLIIQRTAPYQDWEAIRNQMNRNCNVDTLVPAMVSRFAEDYDNVVLYDLIPEDTVASVLTMTIKDARGMTGGAYSGAKSITVEGTLKQDGRVLGTFTAQRASSMGHGLSMQRNMDAGTCQLLSQCATAIGKDVARWLEKPTMDARLGNVRKLREKKVKSTDAEVKTSATAE